MTVWQLISEYFNDPDFNPTSTPYPDLNDDFRTSIDLSYSNFERCARTTPDKVKDKFGNVCTKLSVIMQNDTKSGGGGGMLEEGSPDAKG